ncbi:unnamed protein product [Coffea canephora]|uniref:Uncharacterized protein n=1 Tax=Coffea canephora TaxID=49390 RepID=A0A068V5V4_COFCA|nr:unnamed protein product [Coffea canephora]
MASISSSPRAAAAILVVLAIVLIPTLMLPSEAARPTRELLARPPFCPACVCCAPPPSPNKCCPCVCSTPGGPLVPVAGTTSP